MTQDEKRVYLIKELLLESLQYKNIEIPNKEEEQKELLRSLMNIQLPRPIGEKFLKVQDEYLSEEGKRKGIINSDTLPLSSVNSHFILWRGDITTLKIDAIVNAANSTLRGCFVPCHSCVDNIIHSVSGIQLRLDCDKLMTEQGYEEPTGKAKITSAYNLPCRYVLHTVGPIVVGVLTKEHRKQLADCYRSCLELAAKYNLKSIAFCCISTGEFHFPQKEAARIAVETVLECLEEKIQIERVVFNVFKQEDDNKEIIYKMVEKQTDMKIPIELIPYCPICGKPITMNLRTDQTFVEDKGWHMAKKHYLDFLEQCQDRKVLFLELGVGRNTPGIIKYPFWQMTMENPKAVYVCINYGEAVAPEEIEKQSICISGDIGEVLKYTCNYK